MNYFNKLPVISYNGQSAINILASANLSAASKANRKTYYPYVIAEEDRIDRLSNNYYDSPGYTWLIWLANNTIDPYYDLPLTETDLMNYIVTKYGSIETAQSTIAFFRNNWYNDSTRLTIGQWTALPDSEKKYWDPILDANLQVSAYKRKAYETSLNTNRIITMNILNSTGMFTVGEKVFIDSSSYGFVTYADANTVTIKTVFGQFAAVTLALNPNTVITGDTSGFTATIDTATVITTTAALTDSLYWEPLSFFDYELEANEAKRNIKLISSTLRNQTESELTRVMQQL